MKREIKSVKDLVKALEWKLSIPDNHHLVAVIDELDNGIQSIVGFVCAEDDKEDDYPVYTSEELIAIYGERKH